MDTRHTSQSGDTSGANQSDEVRAARRLRQQLSQEFYDTLVYTLSDILTQLESVRTLWLHNPQQAYVMLAQVQATTHRKLASLRQQLEAMREPLKEKEAAAGGPSTSSFALPSTEEEDNNDQGVPLRRPDNYAGGAENDPEHQP